MFGYDLSRFCESQGTDVPMFFMQFLEYIEAKGSKEEGLYREAGASSSVKKLKDMIDKGDGI